MKANKKFRADLIAVTVLFGIGLVLGAVLLIKSRPGAVVQIRVSGVVTQEYPLASSQTVTITGKDGGTNIMEIKNGEASFLEATCPDGLCIHMGKIGRDGQSIVCLPNEVVAEVVAAHEDTSILKATAASEESEDGNQVDSVAK